MSTDKKRYATKDFTDAGTGKSFKFGEHVETDAGEMANYEAAGLLGDKPADTAAKPTEGGKTA